MNINLENFKLGEVSLATHHWSYCGSTVSSVYVLLKSWLTLNG